MPYTELIRQLRTNAGNGEGRPDASEPERRLSPLLVSVRRHLHMHPEVGFEEHQTSAFIREVLEMHGLEVQGPIAETGLYTDIVGDASGPFIGYRADIDALPIQDEKSVPYASQVPGVAHLCGHDGHTAIAIGVAVLLNELRDRLPGRVRVFFQPNEEGMPSGAPRMIEAGVLDGLEAVYGLHVDPTLEAGRFGLISGATTAAADQFDVTVRGATTGHSARPHEYADTIWIASQIMSSLYQLIGRRTNARNPAVLTVCRVHGGEAFNVIPASVQFGGTLRTTDPADRIRIKEMIQETSERIANAYGASAEVVIHSGSPSLVNDPRLIRHVEEVIVRERGQQAVHFVPAPSMGSEDFAHYVQRIPGAFVRLGISSGPDTSHTLHDGYFDLDESTLAPAAQAMTEVLLAHLSERPLSSNR